jgi:serine protease SohB
VTQFLAEYGLFLAKTLTWVVALLAIAVGLVAIFRSARGPQGADRLDVKNLNERYEQMAEILNSDLLSEEAFKRLRKQKKAEG